MSIQSISCNIRLCVVCAICQDPELHRLGQFFNSSLFVGFWINRLVPPKQIFWFGKAAYVQCNVGELAGRWWLWLLPLVTGVG